MPRFDPIGTATSSVKVVWCFSEHCSAIGPRYTVSIRHAREVVILLRAGGCPMAQAIGGPAEDAIERASGAPYSAGSPRSVRALR